MLASPAVVVTVLRVNKAPVPAHIWQFLESCLQERTPIEGVVLGAVKGGVRVDVGMEAFMPGSLVAKQELRTHADSFAGHPVAVFVERIDRPRSNVVVSDARLDAAWMQLRYESLQPGEVFTGVVSTVLDYGVFVDIGGIEGMVHVSELSWGRVDDPRALVQRGDHLEVQVLSVDVDARRISLSAKACVVPAWFETADRVESGVPVDGKVVKVVMFGVFVDVGDGVQGLVHRTRIPGVEPQSSVADDLLARFPVGSDLRVRALSVDRTSRRIALEPV